MIGFKEESLKGDLPFDSVDFSVNTKGEFKIEMGGFGLEKGKDKIGLKLFGVGLNFESKPSKNIDETISLEGSDEEVVNSGYQQIIHLISPSNKIEFGTKDASGFIHSTIGCSNELQVIGLAEPDHKSDGVCSCGAKTCNCKPGFVYTISSQEDLLKNPAASTTLLDGENTNLRVITTLQEYEEWKSEGIEIKEPLCVEKIHDKISSIVVGKIEVNGKARKISFVKAIRVIEKDWKARSIGFNVLDYEKEQVWEVGWLLTDNK